MSYIDRVKFYLNIGNISDIKTICGTYISKTKLEEHFEIVNIKKHQMHKYREKYKEDCIESLLGEIITDKKGMRIFQEEMSILREIKNKSLKTKIKDQLYFYLNSESQISIPGNKRVQEFFNILSFINSMRVSWVNYLVSYPNGRKIVLDLFSDTGVSSLINFYMVIYAIQMAGDLTNIYYLDKIINLIPYVDIPAAVLKGLGIDYVFPHMDPLQDSTLITGGSMVADQKITFFLLKLMEYVYLKIKGLGGESKLLKMIGNIKLK